jgi:type VI secretion system protein VasD
MPAASQIAQIALAALVSGVVGLAATTGTGATLGCSTTVVAPKEPEPCKLQIVNMAIMASPRINVTDLGDARPVQLRIYQLTTDVRLNNASFQQVWKDDKGILKDDLIKSEEMSIYPDTRTDIRFERDEKALVIAAVALFREPKGRSWYMTMELPPPPSKGSCGQVGEDGGSLLNPKFSLWIDGSRVDEGSDHLDDYPNPGRRRDLSLDFAEPGGTAAPRASSGAPGLGVPTVPTVPSQPSVPTVPGGPSTPALPNASPPSLPTPGGVPGT